MLSKWFTESLHEELNCLQYLQSDLNNDQNVS